MKWLAIVVAVIVIGAGGYFIFSNNNDESSSNETTSTSESTNNEATKELASINKLLERGGNAKCTYDYTDDDGNRSSGTAYFSDQRMFGDFTTAQVGGMTLQSNVLNVDKTQYVWDKDKKEGYKLDLSVIKSQDEKENQSNNSVDQDKEFDFTCVSWSVDDSVFDVPSDVNFIDNTAAIESVQQSTETLQNACASITDPAQKTACEQAVSAQ